MPLSVSLKLNTSDFSCLFFFTGPREVEDAILSIEQRVAEVSATCDPIACVFGAVLISRQDRNFNIPLLFPDRTSILHDFGVRSRACTAPGRLASPISPISTLFIVSTTRLQASVSRQKSITGRRRLPRNVLSNFPPQLADRTRQISLGKNSKDCIIVFPCSEVIHKSDEAKNCSVPLQCAPLFGHARELKWICLSRKIHLAALNGHSIKH